RQYQVEAGLQVWGQGRPRVHWLGGVGLEPRHRLVPVDVIGFHQGKLQARLQPWGVAEQRGGELAIATAKLQHPDRLVSRRHGAEMGQVGADIRLRFCRILLEKRIRVADAFEWLAAGGRHTEPPKIKGTRYSGALLVMVGSARAS